MLIFVEILAMILRNILFFTFLVVTSAIFGQASNVLKHQRLDFEQFKTALFAIQAEPNLHFPKDSLELVLNQMREKLRSPLSPSEQFLLYSEVISKLQCGHTAVQPSKKILREWYKAKQSLPFDLKMVQKKLYIAPIHPSDVKFQKALNESKNSKKTKAELKNEKILQGGTEIIAIDGKTIAEWIEIFSPYLSSDENGIDFNYYVAGYYFDFYRSLFQVVPKNSIEIKVVSKRDTITTSVALGFPPINTIFERSKTPKKSKNELDFAEFAIDKSIGYFKFSSFELAKGPEYNAFLKKSFEQLKSKKVKTLIIDLRGNNGGELQAELLRYFIKREETIGKYWFKKEISGAQLRKMGVKRFATPTRKYLKNHRRLKTKNIPLTIQPAPSSLYFDGDILVITDGGTFSAAAILASNLKTFRGAQLVGSPSGGTFFGGNAGTLPVQLKKSKLTVVLNPNLFESERTKNTADYQSVKQVDFAIEDESAIPTPKYGKPKKIKFTEDELIKAALKAYRVKKRETED